MEKILVVDDDAILRHLLHAILSGSGYSVDMAENGNIGLQKLREGLYDLIISDVNMPVMNGLTMHTRIRTEMPWLEKRILFLTSDSSHTTLSFILENKCSHLFKPFYTPDLLKEVEAVLKKGGEVMPEKLICPNCTKESYTAVPDIYSPCPHCGFIFKKEGQKGENKRSEERYNWSAYCQILPDNTGKTDMLLAKTQDLSTNGLKIRYIGNSMVPGSRINLYIKDLGIQRTADIIWSNSIDDSNYIAGLRTIESIPLSFLYK